MATERGEDQRAGAEGGIWREEEEEAIKTGAKSPAQSLAGVRGHSRDRDRRRGPQGGQGEEEGLRVVPEAASLRQEGLWAGVFPALSLSHQV